MGISGLRRLLWQSHSFSSLTSVTDCSILFYLIYYYFFTSERPKTKKIIHRSSIAKKSLNLPCYISLWAAKYSKLNMFDSVFPPQFHQVLCFTTGPAGAGTLWTFEVPLRLVSVSEPPSLLMTNWKQPMRMALISVMLDGSLTKQWGRLKFKLSLFNAFL